MLYVFLMSMQTFAARDPEPYAIVPTTTQQSARPPRSRRLGQVAMLLGLAVFAGSILASLLMGFAAAPYAISGPTGFNVNLQFDPNDPVESMLVVLAFAHVLLGTLVGVWALTQGIVAVATARGRAFGVVAIVAAALAPGISLVIYLATALANAP
jgi:hypothetical protein